MKYLITILLFTIYNIGQSQQMFKATNDTLAIPKLNFDANGELKMTASTSSSKHDFDFFIGKWKLHNRTLKRRPDNSTEWKEFESTQEMRIVLNGIGNIDNFLAERDGKPYEGMTVRVFNPQTRLWSIYWADSNFGILGLPPVVGSFENNVGHFFSKDVINGKTVITVYRWDARDVDNPVWSQALSEDNGRTWEWNWYMYMSKVK
ncbi:MAG: hypothetical protein ABIN97_08590 [Ginsengibacter sp.]